jgi:hypothetical protein
MSIEREKLNPAGEYFANNLISKIEKIGDNVPLA